jgi:hypothetical protein
MRGLLFSQREPQELNGGPGWLVSSTAEPLDPDLTPRVDWPKSGGRIRGRRWFLIVVHRSLAASCYGCRLGARIEWRASGWCRRIPGAPHGRRGWLDGGARRTTMTGRGWAQRGRGYRGPCPKYRGASVTRERWESRGANGRLRGGPNRPSIRELATAMSWRGSEQEGQRGPRVKRGVSIRTESGVLRVRGGAGVLFIWEAVGTATMWPSLTGGGGRRARPGARGQEGGLRLR